MCPNKSTLPDLHLQSIFQHLMTLRQAILETLAYSDVFDHPLTLDDLHKFLVTPASHAEIEACLPDMDGVSCMEGYYFLSHQVNIVNIRKSRESNSRKAFDRAIFYGHILGRLPFIRMVALTGSLAMLNLSKNRDMDFMIAAKPGHVWTARAFALLFGRLARLFGDVICPNVIVSENALAWDAKNLYTAREFAQMIPISGLNVYRRLLEVNAWVKDFLPNAFADQNDLDVVNDQRPGVFESLLNNKLGSAFEKWEMTRKIARFKAQKRYGAETNFSADVCQGNFDHHGSWALKAYQERLLNLQVKK